jgi:hypothetical protein
MSESLKQQLEEKMTEVRGTMEYRDPELKKIVDENAARLLELAEKGDKDDMEAMLEM